MTTIETDHDPISIQLAADESVTVPGGEVWRVHVTAPVAMPTDHDGASSQTREHELRIDGLRVAGTAGGFRQTNWLTGMSHTSTMPIEDIIVVGGQELTADGSSMNISGFVIKSD